MVGLAKVESPAIEAGVAAAGFPQSFVGVVIALLVLLPETLAAVRAANARGTVTIGLTGRDGGELAGICTASLVVPAQATERIQEGHITLIHLICEIVERTLFPDALPA